jgi:hypothetical protein
MKRACMSSSYARPCKYCGRRISMRQMPAGQWVAFEDDAAHKCAAPPKAKPARKPGLRQVSPPPVAADDDFGEFVLPNDKPASVGKPTLRVSAPQKRRRSSRRFNIPRRDWSRGFVCLWAARSSVRTQRRQRLCLRAPSLSIRCLRRPVGDFGNGWCESSRSC